MTIVTYFLADHRDEPVVAVTPSIFPGQLIANLAVFFRTTPEVVAQTLSDDGKLVWERRSYTIMRREIREVELPPQDVKRLADAKAELLKSEEPDTPVVHYGLLSRLGTVEVMGDDLEELIRNIAPWYGAVDPLELVWKVETDGRMADSFMGSGYKIVRLTATGALLGPFTDEDLTTINRLRDEYQREPDGSSD